MLDIGEHGWLHWPAEDMENTTIIIESFSLGYNLADNPLRLKR